MIDDTSLVGKSSGAFIVEVRGLTKRYAGVTAADNVRSRYFAR